MRVKVGGKYKLIETPDGVPDYNHGLELGQVVSVMKKEGFTVMVRGKAHKAVRERICRTYITQWIHVGCLAPITENKETHAE